MTKKHLDKAGLATLWADITDYAGEKVASMYRFRGSVAAYADLPEDAANGDVYNVVAKYGDYPAGTNFAWTGTEWDALGGSMANATQSAPGLMSASDKAKLDGVEAGANAYELPLMSEDTRGGATLGHGLTVEGGALSAGPFAESGEGAEVTAEKAARLASLGVDGVSVQGSTTGKNLLNFDAWKDILLYRCTAVWGEAEVTLTATADDAYTQYNPSVFPEAAKVPVSEGDVLTLSWESDSNTRGPVFIFPNGQASGSVSINNESAKVLRFTVPSGTTFVTFRFGVSSGGTSITYRNIQLELGSTATAYEPYTGGKPSPSPEYPQAIESLEGTDLTTYGGPASGHVGLLRRGRNLLPNTATSQTINGVTFTVNADGSVTANGTATATAALFLGRVSTEAGTTYTLSGCPVSGAANKYELMLVTGGAGSGAKAHNYGGSALYSETETGSRGAQVIVRSGYTASNLTFYPQLELGSTAHPYTPYHPDEATPIDLHGHALRSLPDGTRDELSVDAAGHVELVQRVGEVVFDGSSDENWRINATNIVYSNYISSNTRKPASYGTKTDAIASHFIALSPNSVAQKNVGFSVDNSNGNVVCYRSDESLAAWTTWLAANPVTVTYPLATPQTHDLGYIDMPDMADGDTLSLLANMEAPIEAGWWVEPSVPGALDAYRERWESADAEMRADVLANGQLANNVYPGRSIAALFPTEVAAAGSAWQFLHDRVAAQDYTGLRVGDWFDVPLAAAANTITQSSVRYVIAAFDHYYNCSDQAIPHHVVCVPAAPVSMAGSSYVTNGSYIMWNTTATNQGTSAEPNPYLNSNLHAWEIDEYLDKLPSTLQSLLLNHRSLAESRYSASGNLNASTGWAWKSLGKIWSPSEMEVYGCIVWGTPSWSQGMDSQFPYFRETKNRIARGRVHWWLRVVSGVSASHVCRVSGDGANDYASATYTWVRPLPCFLLG